jgi:hypothetical protein
VCFKCLWPSRFGHGLLAAKVLKDGFESDVCTLQSFSYEASVLSAAMCVWFCMTRHGAISVRVTTYICRLLLQAQAQLLCRRAQIAGSVHPAKSAHR